MGDKEGSQKMDLVSEISDSEKLLVETKVMGSKKNSTPAVLFALLLGGVGGHKYYMGKTIQGIIYTLFFWTLIPGVIAFVEMFMMPSRVRKYNEKLRTKYTQEILNAKDTSLDSTISSSINEDHCKTKAV